MKIELSLSDFLSAAILLLVFIVVSLHFRKGNSLFQESSKLKWWIGSASLLIIYWNPTLDMINTGIVLEKGYSGLWFLKDILLTLGIAPVLFVPMWARLKLTTDNQLIPLRYSGPSARILQVFRAYYVGLLVCGFLISYYIIGIKKIVQLIWTVPDHLFSGLAIIVLLFIIAKNSLHQKLRTDVVVSVLYLFVSIASVFFVTEAFGGWGNMKTQLLSGYQEKIELFPTGKSGQESTINILFFLLIQWWSVRILDHSNANTQRYFAIGDAWGAFKAIMVPMLILAIMFALSSFIWDAAILTSPNEIDKEASYLFLMINHMPVGLKGLVLITFILGFITTIEAFLSWGASFLVEDVLKNNLKITNEKWISYVVMFLIGTMAIIISHYTEYLVGLKKFVFSISAGVGPVFVFRWFWWRINAWAHLSAMVSSMVYTLLFDTFYDFSGIFHEIINDVMLISGLDYYPVKVISVTLLVTITWLLVMLNTSPDNTNHLKNFVDQTRTGGWWPFQVERFRWRKKLILIVLFGLLGVMPLLIIWHVKFGDVIYGLSATGLWIAIAYLVYRQMQKILSSE